MTDGMGGGRGDKGWRLRRFLKAAGIVFGVLFVIGIVQGTRQGLHEARVKRMMEAAKGDPTTVLELLEADPALANVKGLGMAINRFGVAIVAEYEPLVVATSFHQTETVRALLDHGANYNGLLRMAASHGHTDIMRIAIQHGYDVNAADAQGSTPLHEAAYMGHGDAVKLLIKNGADVNARNEEGRTPLGVAMATDLLKKHTYGEVADIIRSHGGQ